MDYMTWQEAENILTDMFPPDRYAVVLNRSRHLGAMPMSRVAAFIYRWRVATDTLLYTADAYDDQDSMDQGGWAAVVNSIREQVEARQRRHPDACEYLEAA